MGTVKEVGEGIPGISFHVRSHNLKGPNAKKLVGTAVLVAEVTDTELWNRTVTKLEGLRLYSTNMKDELIDALSEEVDTNAHELALTQGALRMSRLVVETQDKRIEEMLATMGELRRKHQALREVVAPLAEQLGIQLPD